MSLRTFLIPMGLLLLTHPTFSQSIPDAALSAPDTAGSFQTLSLLGDSLFAFDLTADTEELVQNLDSAQTRYSSDPNADDLIWLGRRWGYLWRYQTAIDVFSAGIDAFPDDPRLYRHRGHRYISVREFESAVADFNQAAALIEGRPDEIEPDGAPNPTGQPRSTLQFNIWYHLGLAHYLRGEFEQAAEAYRRCMEVSNNDDSRVATSDWLYMTLRRLGRDEEAAAVLEDIRADMEILENASYHRRLLMYKGELAPDALLNVENATPLDIATQGYGVANWYLYNGDEEQARALFERILEGSYWPAFGYIAAETELSRMR